MPTLTSPHAFGSRAGATVLLAALAIAGASWVAAPTAAAVGENGDIMIQPVGMHPEGTDDAPLVCKFKLDAVNFDALPAIAYSITPQPALPSAGTATGTIRLGRGAGHTETIGLADGRYTLTWVVSGATKEKIFRVNCHGSRHEGRRDPGGQISDDHRDDGAWARGDHYDPRGGVHAGGGGLIDTAAAYSPVAAAGVVGLTAVGGAVYLRRNRRRPHGAA